MRVYLSPAILILTGCALASAQTSIYDRTPNARPMLTGARSFAGYQMSPDARAVLSTHAPEHTVLVRLPVIARKVTPHLLGLLLQGDDVDVFLGWRGPENTPEGFENHVEVFRGRRGAQVSLLHDFQLFGGPGAQVRFFRPPAGQHPDIVLIDVEGGASWGTTYAVSPDRQSVDKLFDASDYEFADLDNDGTYELIAWNRRPFDLRCRFGIFSVRFNPEVFIYEGGKYRKTWPPPDWPPPDGQLEDRFRNHATEGVPHGANIQIVAGFADLNRDGVAELIVLQDRIRDKPEQSLAVYRLEHNSFHPVAQVPLPPTRIAYLLTGVRDSATGKEILVRTASPAKCEAGGDPDAAGTSVTPYLFKGNRLLAPPPSKR